MFLPAEVLCPSFVHLREFIFKGCVGDETDLGVGSYMIHFANRLGLEPLAVGYYWSVSANLIGSDQTGAWQVVSRLFMNLYRSSDIHI